jgi:hypothetical protein
MAATAESCTSGLIAELLAEIPGSSEVLERGFVVHSDEAKRELLGVPAETLSKHGAVSEETARAMAEGRFVRRRRGQRHRHQLSLADEDGGLALAQGIHREVGRHRTRCPSRRQAMKAWRQPKSMPTFDKTFLLPFCPNLTATAGRPNE